jgi:predicted homoserine dehydrogenase-like protein
VTVRVGVIGTGIMGADHVNTLHRQVTGAAVSMVADLDLDLYLAPFDELANPRLLADLARAAESPPRSTGCAASRARTTC